MGKKKEDREWRREEEREGKERGGERAGKKKKKQLFHMFIKYFALFTRFQIGFY